jgi:hypothetical protein
MYTIVIDGKRYEFYNLESLRSVSETPIDERCAEWFISLKNAAESLLERLERIK